MPPKGSGRHRYVFTVYALGGRLALAPGASKRQLLAAASGRILAKGELVGTYERR